METTESKPKCVDSAGGVYISERSLLSAMSSSSELSCTLSHNDGESSFDDTPPASWISSGIRDFNEHCPLVASDPERPEDQIVDEAIVLSQILLRSRRLPGTWYFSSNHVMVNEERIKRMVAPLTRLHELDDLAREHAQRMARECSLFHSGPAELRVKFHRPCRRLGENVARGQTIRDIHAAMMTTTNSADKNNILSRKYTHMGMATERGADGALYMCQVFRG